MDPGVDSSMKMQAVTKIQRCQLDISQLLHGLPVFLEPALNSVMAAGRSLVLILLEHFTGLKPI